MTFTDILLASLLGAVIGCPLGIALAILTQRLFELVGRVVSGLWNDYVRAWTR